MCGRNEEAAARIDLCQKSSAYSSSATGPSVPTVPDGFASDLRDVGPNLAVGVSGTTTSFLTSTDVGGGTACRWRCSANQSLRVTGDHKLLVGRYDVGGYGPCGSMRCVARVNQLIVLPVFSRAAERGCIARFDCVVASSECLYHRLICAIWPSRKH